MSVASNIRLAVDELTKSFGGVHAVSAVDFSLCSGQITGLIGANGAGKSTLINVISGILRADRGIIRLNGRDVTRSSAAERARAGLSRTFQHPHLVPGLNCFENVMLGAQTPSSGSRDLTSFLSGPGGERSLAATTVKTLDWLEIAEEKWYKRPEELSPQDWLWIEMARAIVATPSIVLLDEPSVGFTPEATDRLKRCLRSLALDRNVAILIVTHDVSLAMTVSDSIVVMHQGRRIAWGAPDDIVEHPEVIAAYLGKKGHAAAAEALSGQARSGARAEALRSTGS